ncbi:MAG TPA: matrixin family metalloprotease [Polyangiaceae bacterium]|jgi:hypothetical protein
MRTDKRTAAAVLLVVLGVASPRAARAFCRTTTCALPPSFSPSEASCDPQNFLDGNGHFWADFPSYCASLNPPEPLFPVWWRNACVSYDLQENASAKVPYAVASQIVATAFQQWTSVVCPPDSTGTTDLGIKVSDLGPVQCDQVQYNSDQGNQHVILFCDKQFPCDSNTDAATAANSGNTLGLTTVTFDADTGEIFDADTEINATVPISTTTPVPDGFHDLASIITHEMGHFLGLAHSGDPSATMWATNQEGSNAMATLSADDIQGICTIYPSDGTRAVDTSVAASGFIASDACDPTPRHGFQSVCAQPVMVGCAVATDAPPRNVGAGFLAGGLGFVGAAGARRRARAKRRSASTAGRTESS